MIVKMIVNASSQLSYSRVLLLLNIYFINTYLKYSMKVILYLYIVKEKGKEVKKKKVCYTFLITSIEGVPLWTYDEKNAQWEQIERNLCPYTGMQMIKVCQSKRNKCNTN